MNPGRPSTPTETAIAVFRFSADPLDRIKAILDVGSCDTTEEAHEMFRDVSDVLRSTGRLVAGDPPTSDACFHGVSYGRPCDECVIDGAEEGD